MAGCSKKDDGYGPPAAADELIELIQSLSEALNHKHSEDEIYDVLRECNMDADEAVQRLLSLDAYQEVKSRRNRRIEMKEMENLQALAKSFVSSDDEKVAKDHAFLTSESTQTCLSENHKTACGEVNESVAPENELFTPSLHSNSVSQASDRILDDQSSRESDVLEVGHSKRSIGEGNALSVDTKTEKAEVSNLYSDSFGLESTRQSTVSGTREASSGNEQLFVDKNYDDYHRHKNEHQQGDSISEAAARLEHLSLGKNEPTTHKASDSSAHSGKLTIKAIGSHLEKASDSTDRSSTAYGSSRHEPQPFFQHVWPPLNLPVDLITRNNASLTSALPSSLSSEPDDLLVSTLPSSEVRPLSSMIVPIARMPEVLSFDTFFSYQPSPQALPVANSLRRPPQRSSARPYSQIGCLFINPDYNSNLFHNDRISFNDSLLGLQHDIPQQLWYSSTINRFPPSNPVSADYGNFDGSSGIPSSLFYDPSTASAGSRAVNGDRLPSPYRRGNNFNFNQNNASTTWNYGLGSRSVSRDRAYNNLQRHRQQHAGYEQSLFHSQNYGDLRRPRITQDQRRRQQYANLGQQSIYNSELRMTQERPRQNPADSSQSGSPGPSSEQFNQIWKPKD